MADSEIRSQEWVNKIEDLVHQAESLPDAKARTVTIDLLRAVLDFHAAGIERMMEIVTQSGAAAEMIVDRIAADDLTSSMLLLHDLHPDEIETRIERALKKLQEVFLSLGAKLSLLAVEPPTVRLRFESQRAWPGATVKTTIEQAIFEAAPEITTVVLEGLKESPLPDFVPVSDLLAGSAV